MNYTIFVYGTLMKDRSNHHYLEKSRYLGEASLNGYVLYDTDDAYPAAVAKEGSVILGEVYEIDGKTKEECDELEEVGILYDCKEVEVIMDGKPLKALFYEYIEDVSGFALSKADRKWDVS